MELNLIVGSFLFSVLNSHYIPSTHLRTDGQVSIDNSDNSESGSTFAVVVEQEQAIFFPFFCKGRLSKLLKCNWNPDGTHTYTQSI